MYQWTSTNSSWYTKHVPAILVWDNGHDKHIQVSMSMYKPRLLTQFDVPIEKITIHVHNQYTLFDPGDSTNDIDKIQS